MAQPRSIFALVIGCVCILLVAGCMTTPALENQSGTSTQITVTPTMQQSKALYKVTIAQPDGSHAEFIRMESDVYNLGEVIDFSLVTDKNAPLPTGCDLLSFRVFFRNTDGIWKELPGTFRANVPSRTPGPASTRFTGPEPSIPEYRLDTTGWIPGYYKIQSDCLLASHEFILQDIHPTNK